MKTTIFCPNCGTANRDNAEVCVECGSVIPKYGVEASEKAKNTSSNDFGIDTSSTSPPPPPPPPPPPQSHSTPSIQDFGISVGYTTPDEDAGYTPVGSKIICERCGSVLRSDDRQCSGCGQPIQKPAPQEAPSSQPQSYPTQPSPYTPVQEPSQQQSPISQTKQPSKNVAKCAKCGSIVYDYETRCSNCGRILSSPTPTKVQKKPTTPSMPSPYAPVGTARCSRCNAIVYPHQTVCPNCSKPLEAVKQPRDVLDGPGQRMSRCRRCGHIVYPTDSVCPNCGRNLDPT